MQEPSNDTMQSYEPRLDDLFGSSHATQKSPAHTQCLTNLRFFVHKLRGLRAPGSLSLLVHSIEMWRMVTHTRIIVLFLLIVNFPELSYAARVLHHGTGNLVDRAATFLGICSTGGDKE